MTESNEESGYGVARYIIDLPKETLPNIIVIHSMNPVGARNMLNLLADRNIKAYEVKYNSHAYWQIYSLEIEPKTT